MIAVPEKVEAAVAATDAEAATADSASEAAAPESKLCPKGHSLTHARATAGTCDRCIACVPEGKLVSDCRECNWYLCTTCTPIVECPQGHALRTAAAIQGKCDGCGKTVEHGAMVTDCRMCNWYLCHSCQPAMQCPSGHPLKMWATQHVGNCGLCNKLSKQGDMVMDCRSCEWHKCASCHPLPLACPASESEPATPLPQCPQGHSAVPTAAMASMSCSQCARKIRQGTMLSECIQCAWHLCMACQPIRQCKLGHKLEARPATPGTCDGCGVKVLLNQSVLDCRRCNWYLCGSCHLSPAHGGA